MKNWKRIMAAALSVIIMVPFLVACNSNTAATTKNAVATVAKTSGFKIGMSTGNFGNTWCAQFVEDFQTSAEEYKKAGIIADYQVTTSSADLTQQINQCNAMINSGIDALLIWCVSPTGVQPIIDLAKEKGVLVIVVNDAAAFKDTYAILGNSAGFQKILTNWMVDQLNGKGNIVEITGIAGNAGNSLRVDASKQILDKYPDIKILASAPGNWSTTDAQAVMTTFLSTYNNIDGVLSQDVMGDGILKAYQNAGKTPTLVTGDYVKSYFKNWTAIPELNSIAVTYDPGVVVTGLDVAINLLSGKTFKDGVLIPNPLDSTLINTIMVDPAYVVTKDGDQNASWMKGLVGTKAITLVKAMELLADKEDTAALDGWLTKEDVLKYFN